MPFCRLWRSLESGNFLNLVRRHEHGDGRSITKDGQRGRGKFMKRPVTKLSLLIAAATMATGCVPVRHNLPPEQRLMEPGPGVGGPGPGVLGPVPVAGGPMAGGPMAGGMGPMAGGIMQAGFADCGPDGLPAGAIAGGAGGMLAAGAMMPAVAPTVQVTFGAPESMRVRFDATGGGMFDSEPLIVPARQNFPQGGLYRLKITNILNREGVELYPTLELAHANPRSGAYLAHNSIPVQFSQEDFDQVLTGNFVTKVIYLPDPEFQGPALAGVDMIVNHRLDPGIDPIVEADRRGSILAIIRLGDKDIEMAGGAEAGSMAGMMGPNIPGMPVAFAPALTEGCGPVGLAGGRPGNPMPPSLPGMVAGVTAPQYGMPMSGTPIGLPGPPHIPLGAPAGLKKHVIRNHTPMHMPQPVSEMKIDVRQAPGQSYPNPVSRIHLTEQNVNPGIPMTRPHQDAQSQRVY